MTRKEIYLYNDFMTMSIRNQQYNYDYEIYLWVSTITVNKLCRLLRSDADRYYIDIINEL